MRSDTKTGTIVGGLLVALAAFAIGWSVRAFVFPSAAAEEHGDEESAPAIEPSKMSVRVTTALVSRGDLPIVVVAAGVVTPAPDAERTLSSRASGRVEKVLVADGESVKSGALLVRFERAPLEANLALSRAALAQADSQLSEFEQTGHVRQTAELDAAARRATSARELADAQLARFEKLQSDGLVSDKALAEAKQAADQAHVDETLAKSAVGAFASGTALMQHENLATARAAAEANVRDAERIVAEAEVLAPADGRITQVAAHAGEKLDAGATLGRMLVTDARIVRFSVSAAVVHDVAVGAHASWADASGANREGHVVRTGGEIDAASGLIDVFVEPESGAPPLSPGLTVRGEVELHRLENVVLVPEGSVVRSNDEPTVVMVGADETAKIVHVKVLGRHAGLIAVEGEIKAGDRVITEGGYNLPDGAHVVDAAKQRAPDEK